MIYPCDVVLLCDVSLNVYRFQSDTNPNKGTYVDLLKENAILLASVAFVEFSFLHMVAENYVYGDANLVKKQILISLKKYTQQ